MAEPGVSYVIVNNIPKLFHSYDLRSFFSEFLETEGFVCFHFRHRPEVQRPSQSLTEKLTSVVSKSELEKINRCVTSCCVVKVDASRVDDFIRSYNRKHWIDSKGHDKMTRCFIKKVSICDEKSGEISAEDDPCSEERSVLSRADIANLIEMQPPPLMPRGNVGTPSKYFLEQIRLCRLPASIITKLRLKFSHSRGKRLYGCVNFDYGGRHRKGGSILGEELVRTAKGNVLSETYVPGGDPEKEREEAEEESADVDEDYEEEEEEEEEWDRYESLHDDVTQQERIKERLFEEKIELKWEKGGSGLVFYTDAQFWDQQDGDFDAKTSDDWDVDMTTYYEPGSGDKDSRDLLKMRLEERLRQGIYPEKIDVKDFAGFEKYSNGFGRRMMELQGWKEGEGLGKTVAGISEPLVDMGQLPRDKKGFGYRGEKLNRHPMKCSRKRRKKYSDDDDDCGIRISTIYDNPMQSDKPEPLLRSSFLTQLKYRKEFLKASSHKVS